MSDNDVRRLRRIIEGPAPARPATEVRQTERFQRALGSGRRSESRSEGRGALPASSDARSSSEPVGTTGTGANQSSHSTTGLRPMRPVVPVMEGTESEEELAPELPKDLQSMVWMGSAVFTPPPPDWDKSLVRVVSTMCQRADPSFQNWSIVVPLNPAALPDTELRLTLSPHRLQLRFHTQSTRSFDLVSKHRDVLLSMLEQALPYSREIDIDLT